MGREKENCRAEILEKRNPSTMYSRFTVSIEVETPRESEGVINICAFTPSFQKRASFHSSARQRSRRADLLSKAKHKAAPAAFPGQSSTYVTTLGEGRRVVSYTHTRTLKGARRAFVRGLIKEYRASTRAFPRRNNGIFSSPPTLSSFFSALFFFSFFVFSFFFFFFLVPARFFQLTCFARFN